MEEQNELTARSRFSRECSRISQLQPDWRFDQGNQSCSVLEIGRCLDLPEGAYPPAGLGFGTYRILLDKKIDVRARPRINFLDRSG